MTDTGVITGVSVSHGRATVDEIEAASGESAAGVVADLLARDGVDEAFALQTCNRAEAYVVTGRADEGRAALSDFATEVRDGAVDRLDHEASLRHLMRVAAGLESLVIGEDQILGQVRDAFEAARGEGGVGPMLEEAVTKAIHVGERARSETAINEGSVSLGSAAVDLARTRLGLAGATALVVGAGEMGTLAARALAETAVDELVVANRTVSKARHVACEVSVDARAAPLSALGAEAADADLVVSATGSPDPVVGPATLSGAGETVCIDLGQPRDVDPAAADLDPVEVHDIDDLEAVTDETRERRQREARRVEAMIDDEFDRLLDAFKRKQADDAIGAMYESAERVKRRELETALTKLETQGGLTDEQRETIESMADALVGQLLAAPTKSLREAAGEDDWTTIQTAMQLFNPDFEGDAGGPDIPDGMPRDLAEADADDIPQHVLEKLGDD